MNGAARSPAAEKLATTDLRVRLGGRAVVDGITLALRPGEVTAIVGPNGAGKSTLLACLAGLRRPDEGEVRLGEEGAMPCSRRGSGLVGSASCPRRPRSPGGWTWRRWWASAAPRTQARSDTGPHDAIAIARALRDADLEGFAHRDVASLSGGRARPRADRPRPGRRASVAAGGRAADRP